MSDFLSADPDGPNYLKPAPGYGQIPMPSCSHDIVPCSDLGEKAQYVCRTCKKPFPESLIEEVEGKYRMKDFSKYGKGPKRR